MAAIEDIQHNVSSFFKHGGRVHRETSKHALKYQFSVTIHRIQLTDVEKIKHPEWQWVVVWTRGAKVAATHYAKSRPTTSGLEIVWQQELTLLGTAFTEKAGGFQEKECKFVLKQMKGETKSHSSVGKVKLNLADYISTEDRETLLDLRLRDKKKNPIGNMSITLACRFLKDYNRETGTCASGISGMSADNATSEDTHSVSSAIKGSSLPGSAAAASTTIPVIARRKLDDEKSDTVSPNKPFNDAVGVNPITTMISPSSKDMVQKESLQQQLVSAQSEIEELRRIVDEQHFENERLRDQVETLTDQLEKRKVQTEKFAKNMTTYEVELLKTAEKQARIEAEVEERLTGAFVPVIQRLEAELAELRAKEEAQTAPQATNTKSTSRWGKRS